MVKYEKSGRAFERLSGRLFRSRLRKIVDGELATFYFRFWSPDRESDNKFTYNVSQYNAYGIRVKEEEQELHESRVEYDCKNLVRVNFPGEVELREFKIKFDGSVEITFSLIIAGAVSLYYFISRYDSFRTSIERLKNDVSQLIGRVGALRETPSAIFTDARSIPGNLLFDIDYPLQYSSSVPPRASVERLFLWYLIATNIILMGSLAALLYRAVFQICFK